MDQATQVMRIRELTAHVGLSKTTIYAQVAAGEFPRPIKLGPRATGWIAADVARWVESRRAAAAPPVTTPQRGRSGT